MIDSCENCKCFLSTNKPNGNGLCRRYPPKNNSGISRSDGLVYECVSDFAWVNKEDWCGEWRAFPRGYTF